MNIVFLGSPGAGKGTQALRVAEQQNFSHISTGDIFREELKNNTPLGLMAKQFIEKGELVPDEIVIDMVVGKMDKLPESNGCLLDGFPRNIAQAKAMEGKISTDLAIYIHVGEDEIIKRLCSRRTCKECGNLQSVEDGKHCLKCGNYVYQRDDDKEEVIMNRLDVYNDQTKPLIEYYKDRGIIRTVDGARSIDEVYDDIIAFIKEND